MTDVPNERLSREAASSRRFMLVSLLASANHFHLSLEEETEKTSKASKSLMHCNFFLTKCFVPGMFDVCFVNLLLIVFYRDTRA